MATTKITEIIKRCEIITQDKTSVRWPKREWLDWYNDAILFVVNLRPDKSVKNVDFIVDETNSKQSIPADGLSLLTITRNVASGRPIRSIPRNQLDDQIFDWHIQTGNDIDHFIYDVLDPKSFYIFPRPVGPGHVIEIVYPFAPVAVIIDDADFDTDTQVIGIDDSFVNPILDFMLYRGYSKDAEYAENGARATSHMQAAQNSIGGKTKADAAAMNKDR
jgi:hypothetical protein